ncbi:thermonuclease family protein [Enterobacter hormaechei]|uniref:thermonuclease family protein n=1 Tax=Enterobacter hormaechei TaxID=158836 RepID=UPI000BB794B5|nr:thermonuclease family protein [Enterobacter hormaechei]
MKRRFCSLVLFVVAFSASADISGRIVRVLDGDTVEILDQGNQLKRVRLAGIDAPEKNQPFGQRSRQELSSMVTQRIVTVTGEDEDRYGRLLGTVWLGAKDVNAEQIRKGLAWAYRYHGKPVRSDYATLEDEARRQATGLWSVPGQTEPWRWRSKHHERGSISDAP